MNKTNLIFATSNDDKNTPRKQPMLKKQKRKKKNSLATGTKKNMTSIVNSNLVVNISNTNLLAMDLNMNDVYQHNNVNANVDNNNKKKNKKNTTSSITKKRKNGNSNSKKNNNNNNKKKKTTKSSSVKMKNMKNNNINNNNVNNNNTKKRKVVGDNNNKTKKQVGRKKIGKQVPRKSLKRTKKQGDKAKLIQLEKSSREGYLNYLMMGNNGGGNNVDVFTLRNKLSPSISPQMPITKTISLSPPMMHGQAPSFYSGYRHQSVGETMGVEGTGTLFLPIENSDAEQVYRTPTPGLTDFTIKSSTPIRGVDSWDNVGKLFDKKRMPTPSSMLQQDGISFGV